MQRTNYLAASRLAGGQHEGAPVTTAADSTSLASFLSGLPSLALSETGRRNVCRRFALTDDELTTALAAYGPANERWTLLPIPTEEFGADALACALVLTGTTRPTAAQLNAALLEMYPVGGPTAASLVAAGWLLPTVDKKALRLPPLSLAIPPSRPYRNGNR